MTADDSTLWQRWRQGGDPDAFAEIVSRHSGMVYATCRRILGNAADAEDAAQDCFLELLNGRATVQTTLAPWLYTVAVRRARNRAKAETRRHQRERQFVTSCDQSTEILLDDLLEIVDVAIAGLPEKLRTTVICRFLEGRSYEEIAQRAGVAESTVRYRTSKGIERIRTFLKRRGVPTSTAVLTTILVENMAEAAPPALVATLGNLAIAGTTASIVGETAGTAVAGVTLKTIGGLLIMKKLAVSAVVVAGILAAVWGATRIVDEETDSETRTGDAPSQAKRPRPETVVTENQEVAPPEVPPLPEVPPAEAPGIVAPPEGVRVAGVVVDEDGGPVAGAHVVAQFKGTNFEETESSSDGAFEVYVDVICNDLSLQAEKESYESEVFGPSRLREPGLDGLVLSLTVPRMGSIAGVVVDRTGNPVPDLFVNAHRAAGVITRQVEGVRTDSKGAFNLAGLAPGTYGLAASFYRRNPEILMDVKLGAGQAVTGLRAVLDVGDLTIAGSVVNTDGMPIEGADVLIHGGFGGDTSDEEGRFLIEGLHEGTFMVDAVHEAYSWAHSPYVAAGTSDLEIVMLGKSSVEGRVIQADTGESVTDFDVFHAQQAEAMGAFANRAHTVDPEGRFTIADLDSGKMTVTIRAVGFAPVSQDLSLSEHQTVGGLEFRLVAGERLEGRVETVHGAPIAGACIYSGPRPGWPDADVYIARSDAAGRFEVACLSPATQQVSAYHPDYAPAIADVVAASEVRIVLRQPGSIEGTVTREGKPVPGMAVMAMYGGQDMPSVTKTDGDGAYALEGLAPGTFMVVANPARMRDGGALQETAIIEAGRVTQVDFEFQSKSSRIEGRITIAGEGVGGAKVALISPGAAGGHASQTTASPDGFYQIDDLAAGEAILSVEATAPGGEVFLRGIPVEIAEDAVVQQDVAFATGDMGAIGGEIAGTREDAMPPHVFVFEQGAPLPDMGDVLAVVQYTVYAYSVTQCADDGTYYIGGLAQGTYVAIALEMPKEAGDLENVRIAVAENVTVGDETAEIHFDFRE